MIIDAYLTKTNRHKKYRIAQENFYFNKAQKLRIHSQILKRTTIIVRDILCQIQILKVNLIQELRTNITLEKFQLKFTMRSQCRALGINAFKN